MGSWPLVGRREELAYVRELVGDPTMAGLVLAGPAGVGKTRLLSEALDRIEAQRIERVTATRSAQLLPFGALAHILPEQMAADRADLLAVIGRNLSNRSEGRPVVLAVDDAHLLDPLSAAFVHHVTTTGLATTILTIRSGEAAPDAITALYRDDLIPRLELQPISRAEFDDLVRAALAGRVEVRTLDRLWAAAAGNALYARELILDALEAGTLREEHSVWRWTGGAGTAPRLREMILSRIGHLTIDQRRLLDVLAIGEPLGTILLRRLVPAALVDDLEHLGLVTVAVHGRRTEARLAHPLFGEALLAELSSTDRRAIHQALAEELETTGTRRREDLLRLATWRLEAGGQPDHRLLTDAARLAIDFSDFDLAERLARAATGSGGGFEATVALGRAIGALGRFEESEALLVPLLEDTAPSDADDELLADALALTVGHGLGRVDDAVRLLMDAEARVSDVHVRALMQGHRAALLALAGRFTEAATVGEAALELVDDDATRLRSLTSVGNSLIIAGRIDRSIALSDEMLPIAFQLQDELPRGLGWVVGNRTTALVLAGRFQEALALLELSEAQSSLSDPAIGATIGAFRGRIALACGQPGSAVRYLTDAISVPAGSNVLPRSWALSIQAEAFSLLGDAPSARESARRAAEVTEPAQAAYEVDGLRAQAWIGVAEGADSDAIALLLEAADLACSRGQVVFELLALSDALRMGEARVARRARDLAADIDGAWAVAIGRHADAVLGEDPQLFEEAATTFEEMGSRLVAAELFASASAAFGGRGLRAREAAAARRSRTALESCEGALTPMLKRASDPVPLSRREREVATMAARGLTNNEIAEALHLSVRTVESHLYAAFAKLGVTDRRQLVDVLPRR